MKSFLVLVILLATDVRPSKLIEERKILENSFGLNRNSGLGSNYGLGNDSGLGSNNSGLGNGSGLSSLARIVSNESVQVSLLQILSTVENSRQSQGNFSLMIPLEGFTSPLKDYGFSTWFHQRQSNMESLIFQIYVDLEESEDITVQFDDDYIQVDTRQCTLWHEAKIKLRTWYHLALGVDSNRIKMFLDGKEAKFLANDCNNMSNLQLKSNSSYLNLGGAEEDEDLFIGSLADIRFYDEIIDQSVVEDAIQYSDTIGYVDVLKNITNFPKGFSKRSVFYQSITDVFPNSFFLARDKMNIWHSKHVCSSVGGELYHPEVSKNNYIRLKLSTESDLTVWVNSANNGTCNRATITSKSFTIVQAECKLKYQFMCEIPSTLQYKLIGLLDDPVDLTFVDNLRMEFELESDSKYNVKYEGKKIVITNTKSDENDYSTVKEFHLLNLMGRKVYQKESGMKTKRITLSVCDKHQFTCNDGSCVLLNLTCNFIFDCPDKSDEYFCNAAQKRPEFYDKHLSGKSDLPMNMSIVLNRMVEVSLDDNLVSIELSVDTRWNDERVMFCCIQKDDKNYILNRDRKFYWHPNMEMEGVANDYFHTFALADQPGKMYVTAKNKGQPSHYESHEAFELRTKDAIISHEKSSLVKITCPLELFTYPFDVQTCFFEMKLEGKVRDDVEWNNITISVLPDVSLPTYAYQLFNVTISENKKSAKFTLRFRRLFYSQLIVTFMPCIVLQIIGLSVFAIPLDNLSERLTVNISCLIVMAALFSQISSTLPPSSTIKMLDMWMTCHMVMLAMVFINLLMLHHFYLRDMDTVKHLEKAAVTYKHDVTEVKRKITPQRLNKICALLCVVFYVVIVIFYFHQSMVSYYFELSR